MNSILKMRILLFVVASHVVMAGGYFYLIRETTSNQSHLINSIINSENAGKYNMALTSMKDEKDGDSKLLAGLGVKNMQELVDAQKDARTEANNQLTLAEVGIRENRTIAKVLFAASFLLALIGGLVILGDKKSTKPEGSDAVKALA